MSILRSSLLLAGWLSLAWVSVAFADPGDCSGNGPLVVGHGSTLAPHEAPAFLGEWRLPVSSEDPDVLTAALVRVDLVKSSGGKGAKISMKFSFPDPQPLGLPFTFERAELSWESAGKTYSAQIDWSQNCSGPGRSMYPHQSWSDSIELDSFSYNSVMERPVFRVWGSRN